MDTNRRIELDFCVIELLQHDVVLYELKLNMVLDKEKAEAILNACNLLVKGKYYLVNVMSTKLQPSPDVYDFYAGTKRQKYIIADAFVVKSPSVKMMANFYLKLKKPKLTTRVFSETSEALDWIAQLKRSEQ